MWAVGAVLAIAGFTQPIPTSRARLKRAVVGARVAVFIQLAHAVVVAVWLLQMKLPHHVVVFVLQHVAMVRKPAAITRGKRHDNAHQLLRVHGHHVLPPKVPGVVGGGAIQKDAQ